MGFLVGLLALFISPRVYDCDLENKDICYECVMILWTPSNVCLHLQKMGSEVLVCCYTLYYKIRFPSIKWPMTKFDPNVYNWTYKHLLVTPMPTTIGFFHEPCSLQLLKLFPCPLFYYLILLVWTKNIPNAMVLKLLWFNSAVVQLKNLGFKFNFWVETAGSSAN